MMRFDANDRGVKRQTRRRQVECQFAVIGVKQKQAYRERDWKSEEEPRAFNKDLTPGPKLIESSQIPAALISDP